MLPARDEAILNRIERRARYRWAAPLAEGRDVLDLGCGDGEGASLLAAAGAQSVLSVDPSADAIEEARGSHGDGVTFEVGEPLALPIADRSFGLITCFGPLESAADPEALLDALGRVLEPGGTLIASLGSAAAATEDSAARAERIRRMVAVRFSRVEPVAEEIELKSIIGARGSAQPEGARPDGGFTVVIAGPDSLAVPGPQTATAESGQVEALIGSLSDWEERGRSAEAEASAMRWEMLIAGEKLTALVNHIAYLENRPMRRLRRRLRGGPARILKQDIADPPRPWHRD